MAQARRARMAAQTPPAGSEGPLTPDRGKMGTSGSRDAQCRFVVTLPYPPSVNHLWRHVGGRTLLSAEGRRYRERVDTLVRVQSQGIPVPPHAVSIVAFLPDKRRRDIDNVLKALLDPLYRAIGHDDSVITRLEIEKRAPDALGPRVDVVIAPASDGPGGWRVRAMQADPFGPYRGHICVTDEPNCTCADHAAALAERDALHRDPAERGRAILEAGKAFVAHHKNGQAGQPGHPKTYGEEDVWQAEWDRRFDDLDRALAATTGGR